MTEQLVGYREGNSVYKSETKPFRRVMVGIPMTGLLRAEWVFARYSQVIPCNWSQVDALHWMDQYSPLDFSVADARNIIACSAVEQEFEWLFFLDHDVIIPPTTFIKLNDLMREKKYPVWCGLYFTKSVPSEPLIYRGTGTGYYDQWKMGDVVEVDGIPMGCTLINVKVMKVLYENSPSYMVGSKQVREIYKTPSKVWFSPEERSWFALTGTEDLYWCRRVINEGVFAKAGWPELADKQYPFVIDTGTFCRHIDFNGMQFPARGEEGRFQNDSK